jgi:type IV secretory pathway TrbD component
MFFFLARTRYGPLVQIALGLVCVVIGLFVLTKIMLVLGGLLVVWGIATAASRQRARRRADAD